MDEGSESGRIQQVLHGCLMGFEFLVRDGEHVVCLLWMFVRSVGRVKKGMEVARCLDVFNRCLEGD